MPLVLILLLAGLLQAFPQQVRKRFEGDPNQPLRRVTAIRISDDGEIRAISEGSLYVYAQGRWQAPVPASESWAAELAPEPAGLPVLPATAAAKQADGSLWFGTAKGLFHQMGKDWEYRQGQRWLPHDEVLAVAVNARGDVAVGTAAGVGLIQNREITFAEKARLYEEAIEKYNRRTEFGYVLERGPRGVRDSDNDGLWTSMYGASQCFAYAVKKDTASLENARKAFRAIAFLSEVTQGGTPGGLPGLVARTILPTSGPDPNAKAYTRETDAAMQKRDRKWKTLVPRWPKSADGKWYWKSDVSSDELDGHFFFYGLYYDLVAQTVAEKEEVRKVVRRIIDHLVKHDFNMIDWDGKPTRWGVFSPAQLNREKDWWAARGLNSLSILAYLKVAHHVTGDKKYHDVAQWLIKEHGYAQNAMFAKLSQGVGDGNQSDDEMAYMDYWSLLQYEQDPELVERYAYSLHRYWALDRPEVNPFFNFAAAALLKGKRYDDTHMMYDLTPTGTWLEQSLDTLRRFPLDLHSYALSNSHRTDIRRMANNRGMKRNGRVLPVDERQVFHWNHDPFRLDHSGDGGTLADGTSYLLPYYMGRYLGFVKE